MCATDVLAPVDSVQQWSHCGDGTGDHGVVRCRLRAVQMMVIEGTQLRRSVCSLDLPFGRWGGFSDDVVAVR